MIGKVACESHKLENEKRIQVPHNLEKDKQKKILKNAKKKFSAFQAKSSLYRGPLYLKPTVLEAIKVKKNESISFHT